MDHVVGGVRFQIYPLRRKREAHLLVYYLGSRRVRVAVKGNLDAAQARAKKLAREITGGEAIDALHLTPLDRRVYVTAKQAAAVLGRPVDAIVREHVEAKRILGDASLIEAVRYYRAQHSSDLPAATVAAVRSELLQTLQAKRRRAVTIFTLAVILGKFAGAFHEIPIAQIRREDIDRWLASLVGLAPRTLNNYRAAVVRMFHFARGKYLPRNQATAADFVDPVSDDARGEIAIFKPWEFSKIINAAPDWLRPGLALGAFAGVRSIEICRIEWSAVHLVAAADFPHGYIEIKKAAAKQHRTAARRLIPIQPNLAVWLEPFRFRDGRIFRSDQNIFARALTRLIHRLNNPRVNGKRVKLTGAKIGRPKNGLRHSYGSYRLPVLKSIGALRLEMGNSEEEIFENYREVVAPSEVEAWWNIYPVSGAEPIQLDFAEMAQA